MSKGKLTIKQEGNAPLYNTEKVILSIDGNENALNNCQAIDISMRLEEPTTAVIKMIDLDLDLTDIDYTINMDELMARRLLQRIAVALKDENAAIVNKEIIIDEIEAMTKGMD